MNLAVLTDASSSEATAALAHKWADFLKASFNPVDLSSFTSQLVFSEQGATYHDADKRILHIDFDEAFSDYQRKHRGKTNELIAKALGASKGVKKVLDLSVGMGVDSVFLSQLGFEVIGVERSPLLFVLLSEAFARTRQKLLKSYQLFFADSFDFLRQRQGEFAIDSIYFDPMYPHKKKSALPKQEMVVFRDLVGHDEDAARVLQAALEWNPQRVVVKRPLQAEPLLPGARHAYEGKLVRYDVYMGSV